MQGDCWLMSTVRFCRICLFFYCLLEAAATKSMPTPTPWFGWCKTKHIPKTAAQSGYTTGSDTYCKSRFKNKKKQNEYADKLAKRKKTLAFCLGVQELYRDGPCKHCFPARSCDTCGLVNQPSQAVPCNNCLALRTRLGAARRLPRTG